MSTIKVKAVAGNGVLGSGFRESSLLRGMRLDPTLSGVMPVPQTQDHFILVPERAPSQKSP